VTLFWRIAAPVTCVAAICGAAILWRVHKAKAIERKLAETARAYRVRAEHGDAKAQRSLGSSYARGEGVPKDYAEAVRWFRKAAEQRDAQAQYSLGHSYAHGEARPPKPLRASSAEGFGGRIHRIGFSARSTILVWRSNSSSSASRRRNGITEKLALLDAKQLPSFHSHSAN
jgi:TPR repeat protein